MNVIQLTDRTFEAAVAAHPLLLVGFWSGNCEGCRSTARAYERVAARRPDATFAQLDPGAYPDTAADFRLVTLPTVVVFRDALLVYAQAGPLTATAFEAIIDKVQAVDMVAVRQSIDRQHKAAV